MTRLLLLVLSLLLSACAPQMVTVKRYLPPADPAGQACLQTCEEQLAVCQARCKAQRDACEAAAETRAREALPKALDAYADAMERYRTELLFWRLNVWQDDWFYDRFRPRWAPRPFYGWYDPPPTPPAGPPTLESEMAKARAACRKDCGCQAPYEACFLRCGGQIVEEQRPAGAGRPEGRAE